MKITKLSSKLKDQYNSNLIELIKECNPSSLFITSNDIFKDEEEKIQYLYRYDLDNFVEDDFKNKKVYINPDFELKHYETWVSPVTGEKSKDIITPIIKIFIKG